jgi:hypothetical protein
MGTGSREENASKQKRTTRGKPARKKAGAIVSRRLVV